MLITDILNLHPPATHVYNLFSSLSNKIIPPCLFISHCHPQLQYETQISLPLKFRLSLLLLFYHITSLTTFLLWNFIFFSSPFLSYSQFFIFSHTFIPCPIFHVCMHECYGTKNYFFSFSPPLCLSHHIPFFPSFKFHKFIYLTYFSL